MNCSIFSMQFNLDEKTNNIYFLVLSSKIELSELTKRGSLEMIIDLYYWH